MADKERTPQRRATATPEEYATFASSSPPGGDYKLTVDLVGALQNQLGKLTEAVESLKGQSKIHGEKIDRLSHTMYAAAAVVTVIGGIGLFILNKLWDLALAYIKPH